MPRRSQGAIPLLTLDPGTATPLYRQLADGLRRAILEGRLEPGTRLPSTRSLADDLEVSRSTVVTAFEQLGAEGYLRSRVGSGTCVPDDLPVASAGPVPVGGADPADLRPAAPPPPRPFRPGIPALDEFARGPFGRILRGIWRSVDEGALALTPPAGDPDLRVAVARHLRGSRNVRCTPDDVIVTAGAQEGLAVAFEAVAGAGGDIWIEHPGYIGARHAAASIGARPVPVAVDAHGLDVAAGRRRWPDAAAAYVTPSHQFPTGVTLSLPRRLELLEWAAAGDRWIVEDDYDSEFRLEGRPLPSLQGLDEAGRVIYVGTFSKSLAPSLRLGWLVVPRALRERVLGLRLSRVGAGNPWLQQVLARFMDEGHFARHIRRTRRLYRARRTALAAAVATHLAPRGLALREPTGAMHAVLDLPPGLPAGDLASRARTHGVEALPLDYFAIPPAHDVGEALLLGFAGYCEEALEEGARRLARTLDARDSDRGGTVPRSRG